MLWLILAALFYIVPSANAVGGYLSWNFTGDSVFYPFNAPFPPAILRGDVPGAERVVTLQIKNGQWEAVALNIVSGQPVWNAVFPGAASDVFPSGVTTGTSTSHYVENLINLAMIQIGSNIVALDGKTGQVAWQWPIAADLTIRSLSGWGDTIAILATGVPVLLPGYYQATTPTVLLCLDSVTGTTRWVLNSTQVIPQTPQDAAYVAVEAFIAGEDFLYYSRASKLAAVSKEGNVMWSLNLPLENSVGTGTGANITHLQYIPKKYDPDGLVPARILVNANNWSFQRFILLSVNNTNFTSPPTTLWRSKRPETALDTLYFTQPVVDPWINQGYFFYWSNRTEYLNGTETIQKIYLIGADLRSGDEIWKVEGQPLGLPAVFEGRVFVVTSLGLSAIQSATGAEIWQVSDEPGPGYSYELSPTFGNTTGLLVASRCLGPQAPNLCMYSAFAPASGALKHGAASLVVAILALLVPLMW